MNIFQKFDKTNLQVAEKRRQRCVASFLLLTFFAQTLFAAPAIQGNTDLSQVSSKVSTASFLNELQIPSEIGQIVNFAVPKNLKKNSNPILFIQDAHANPDAQKNIAAILYALAKNNQLAGVAVEGAFGPVDARLLDVFDDEKTNREFSEQLVSQGQLTGAEIFSRDATDFNVSVQGADDSNLYLQSFKAYQQVTQDKASQAVFEKYRKDAMRMEMTLLNPDLARFLRERRTWLQRGSEAADYVRLVASLAKKALGVELADPVNQFEWPSLMRLVRSLELEDQLNAARVQADIARLKKDWSGKDHASLFESAAEALTSAIRDRGFRAWLEKQENVSVKTTRRFLEELSSASAKDGIALLNYPDLLSFSAILILHEEIVTKTLMEELAPLEEKIEAKLLLNSKEREVIRFSKDLELAGKLIHLKLTRDDYLALMQREADFSAAAVHARLSRILIANGLPLATADLFVQSTLDSALNFYRLSNARDEVLVKKTLAIKAAARKNSDALKVMVLIAGGYHQEGILRELEQQGVEHAVVTPQIKNMPTEPLYEKVMSGEGSELAEVISAASSTLMAEILGAVNYLPEGAASWRREGVILDGMFGWNIEQMVNMGQTPEDVYEALSRALQRADAQGLIGRARLIFKDAVQPGSSPELVLSLLEHGLELHYEFTPEGARQTRIERLPAGTQATQAPVSLEPSFEQPRPRADSRELQALRSEVRASVKKDESDLDKDAFQWLAKLPRNKAYTRALALMIALEEKKKAQTPPLTQVFAQSLTSMGPARNIPVIEAVVDEIASEYNLKTLPIAYRAAVVLQAFDAENFPEVHKHLLEMMNSVNISNAEDRLSAADYRKLMDIGEREHLTDIDQYVLLHTALNRYLIDLPRKERRALEKEAMVIELMKELDTPGTGDLKQMVFLTDLHGGTKVGDLIGYSLGLKNYRRIRNVHDLTQRLQAENIDIEKKNILFVGGSDYVDRGPNPYRAFEFVRWLRDKGKLKFINGNHDLWKDWNLLGVHLRVQDALSVIAQSANFNDSSIARYAGILEPKDEHMKRRDGTFASFVSTIGKSDAQIEQIQAGLTALVKRFLNEIQTQPSEQDADEIIKRYANEVIDFGSNDNHSLEWWARDWYEHAGWADTFLDEMNEILINRMTAKINGVISDSTGVLQAQLREALSVDLEKLPEVLRADRDVLLANLEEGRLFNNITAALFSAHDDVKAEKAKIEELKAKNAQIRKSNETLAAQGRFDEQTPQFSVPTTFPLTAKHAQEYLEKINAQIAALRSLVNLESLSSDDLKLVTAGNYRENAVVVDTVLWNLKHLRLVYVDAYGNAYLHGIIPIEEDSLDFKVQYKGLPGVAAIERMQYDIRRFFEKYDVIPDTPEFRATMEREVGEAFRILNNWYSDKTAYLKPAAFQEFVAKGGPASYSYAAASPYHARVYHAPTGAMFVGHIDLTKMRDAKAPYWIFGMAGGIINGDHDLSEGYNGLGGVITQFMRGADGLLTGLRRFGYEETVASLSKDLKDTEKEKKKKEKALSALGEISDANEALASPLQQEIGELAAEIDDLRQRLARKREKVEADQGETIGDITLHELPESERMNAQPYLDGGDYAYYYAQRFLQELISDYTGLIEGANDRGLHNRANYYYLRLSDAEEQLTFLRTRHGAKHPLHPARSEVRSNVVEKIKGLRPEQIEQIPTADLSSDIREMIATGALKQFPALQAKLALYSAGPGTGKGALMTSTFLADFGKPNAPYQDMADKFVLIHTRGPRVDGKTGESEKDGYHYHFIKTGEELLRLSRELGPEVLAVREINREWQGLPRKTFIRKNVKIENVEGAENLQTGDRVTTADFANKTFWVERGGLLLPMTAVRIPDGKAGVFLPQDLVTRIDGSTVLVDRQIRGIEETFQSGKLTILEGGYEWFKWVRENYSEVLTLFLSPFRENDFLVRARNMEWIRNHFTAPEDVYAAFEVMTELIKSRQGEISLAESEDLQAQLLAGVEAKRGGVDAVRVENARIIEAPQDFLKELDELRKRFGKGVLEASEASLAAALAYEVQYRLFGRDGVKPFRVDAARTNPYDRVLEGVFQILSRNDYGQRNVLANPFGYTADQKARNLTTLSDEFARRIFVNLLLGINRSEVRSPSSLEELQTMLSERVGYVNVRVGRWERDLIDGTTKAEFFEKMQRISQILSDGESGVLEDSLIRLISDFRTFSHAPGEAEAEYLEALLNPARQWDSALKRRSEVRLGAGRAFADFESYLARQGRDAGTVFTTAIAAAAQTVDQDLASRYPAEVRKSLFGESVHIVSEAETVTPSAETRQKMETLLKAQQTVERPKTVVLVSINGQVPQIDPRLMDLLPGSRVVVLDRRGEEAVGRRQFSKLKLSSDVQIEHGWFQGEYPKLDELAAVFEKAAPGRSSVQEEPGQAALPLLVLPYVEERFLNQYAVLQTDNGLVVRTPKMRGTKLRESFSKFLGLRAIPSELRNILPDEFTVLVREKGFSSAFIPLGSEGRFASLMESMLQIRTIESAA